MRLTLLLTVAIALAQMTEGRAESLAFPATPEPATCVADAVSPEALLKIFSNPVPASLATKVVPAGSPAPESVASAVTEVITGVFACLNAGEPLRAYRHYSTGYLRQILSGQELHELQQLATPRPQERDEWTTIVDIRNVRILADGRAVATVILDPALIPVQKMFDFYLVKTGDRWLVDDVLDELEFELT